MHIKSGIDILDLKRFLKSYDVGKDSFLNRIFTPYEIRNNTTIQLASIFSLKESLIKALSLPSDSWQMMNTKRLANGKLKCSFDNEKLAKKIISLDTSVSHEGNLIIAMTVAILRQ